MSFFSVLYVVTFLYLLEKLKETVIFHKFFLKLWLSFTVQIHRNCHMYSIIINNLQYPFIHIEYLKLNYMYTTKRISLIHLLGVKSTSVCWAKGWILSMIMYILQRCQIEQFWLIIYSNDRSTVKGLIKILPRCDRQVV